MIWLAISLIILGLAAWLVFGYRKLVVLRKLSEEKAEEIATYIKLRHESIAQLVKARAADIAPYITVANELAVVLLKANAMSGQLTNEYKLIENKLGNYIGQLLQMMQANEQLSRRDDYIKIRDIVLDVEDALMLACQQYNGLVMRYNMEQKMPPAKFFAVKAGFIQMLEFDLEDIFVKYPLKIKMVMPLSQQSILLRETKQIKKEGKGDLAHE